MNVEDAVRSRYSAGAAQCESSLCCATSYDPALLEVIPPEVVERDYGCGDPSRWLCAGETVVDLGSGSGKHCFIAAQIVGASGRVIGIDMNDDMLALSRGAAPVVAERLGYANVEFRRDKIQDLATIEDASVDVVVSNCVLNLVRPGDKARLFRQIHRILREGGRAVIADIVSSADVPQHLQDDPDLWSGCISGALREDDFAAAFIRAGMTTVEVLERGETPWQTVEDIEFRAMTVRAYKNKQPGGCCG